MGSQTTSKKILCRYSSRKTHLPEDLVLTEILTRLSVRELIRWQYVCKSWLHTISRDCHFTVEQWRHSASGTINSDQNIVFIGSPGFKNLIIIPTNSKNGGVDTLAFSSNHIGILAAYLRGFKPPCFSNPLSLIWNKDENPRCRFVVYDSLHGLLLLLVYFSNAAKSAAFFYVCNPMFPPGSGVRFLQMDTYLIENPLDIRNGAHRRYALAFDPALSANRFKIVSPFLRREWFNIDRWYNQWGFEVFDSCTGKWAVVVEDKDIIVSHLDKRLDLNMAIFVRGMLYWDQMGFSLSLICFDPWEEMSGTVALPVLGPAFDTNKRLGRWEDRLTLLSSNMVELDFWVLGDSTGWMRLYRLDLKAAVARHLDFFSSLSLKKLLGGGGVAQEEGGSIVESLFNDYCAMPQWCCTDKVVYLWWSSLRRPRELMFNKLFLSFNREEDLWSYHYEGQCGCGNNFFPYYPTLFRP